MKLDRRAFMGAGLATGLALLAGQRSVGAASQPSLDPIPPLPPTPAPGKPGDFDFLSGEWRIHHRQPKAGSQEWIEFDGEATVHGILAGVGSVEELRIPVRKFSGMGLRLGVMTVPGVPGSFENGAGIFVSDDEQDGKPVKWVGVWESIRAVQNRCERLSMRTA